MPLLGLGTIVSKPSVQTGPDNSIQMENSNFLLLESGDYILLE